MVRHIDVFILCIWGSQDHQPLQARKEDKRKTTPNAKFPKDSRSQIIKPKPYLLTSPGLLPPKTTKGKTTSGPKASMNETCQWMFLISANITEKSQFSTNTVLEVIWYVIWMSRVHSLSVVPVCDDTVMILNVFQVQKSRNETVYGAAPHIASQSWQSVSMHMDAWFPTCDQATSFGKTSKGLQRAAPRSGRGGPSFIKHILLTMPWDCNRRSSPKARTWNPFWRPWQLFWKETEAKKETMRY